MDNLQIANDVLAEKSKQFHAVMEEMGEDLDLEKVTSLHGEKTEKLEQIKALSAELNRHGVDRDNLASLKEMRDQSSKGMNDLFAPSAEMHHISSSNSAPTRQKSIGNLFVNSKEFQNFKGLRNWPTPAILDWSFKNAVFREGAGRRRKSAWMGTRIQLNGPSPSWILFRSIRLN